MAEFCINCFNKYHRTHYCAGEISVQEDFCEGCGKWCPCVVKLQPRPLLLQWLARLCGLFRK